MEQDLKQLQKIEAIERLKILQDKFELMPTVTKEFEKDNVLYYSEYVNKSYPAILYWVNNKEEYKNAVREFEEEHRCISISYNIDTHNFWNYTNFIICFRRPKCMARR